MRLLSFLSSTAAKSVRPTIDSTHDFRKYGKKMVDMIADYHDNIGNVPVVPNVEPGYLRKLLPEEAPFYPQSWENICEELHEAIIPGIVNWNSPHFHAYYPTANSYASVMGGMLSDALGCVGFSWMSSPSCTELEMLTMDWLAKSMDLPKVFCHSSDGNGGGVIQGSCSESTLIALLAAKHRKIERFAAEQDKDDDIESKLVAYTSQQAHSSVEKGIRIVRAKMRILETDSNFRLRGDTLRKAVEEDKAKGLVPFFIGASFGTTSVCSFDDVVELGDVAQMEDMWIHVDGAYAGSALICPEYRHLMKGLEKVDSFVVNCHKWLMVNFDCSAFYVRESMDLVKMFEVNPTYLKHAYQNEIPDFRHWQIPLGRRFRSLKLWMVLKSYGVSGLQENIRRQIEQAKIFESFLRNDDRFEIVSEVSMGLVCFQLKGDDSLNRELNKRVNEEKRIHMTPAELDGKLVLRFVVASRLTKDEDIKFAWNEIKKHADLLFNEDDKMLTIA